VAQAHNVHIPVRVLHRAGDDLRHLPVRGRGDPADAGAGHSGGGGAISSAPPALQTFFRVTLPNIKWACSNGVLLCNAPAMGEFGAVSSSPATSGPRPTRCPLLVEILYNEYQFSWRRSDRIRARDAGLITWCEKTVLDGVWTNEWPMAIEVRTS